MTTGKRLIALSKLLDRFYKDYNGLTTEELLGESVTLLEIDTLLLSLNRARALTLELNHRKSCCMDSEEDYCCGSE